MSTMSEEIKVKGYLLLRKLKLDDFNAYWDYVNDEDIKKQFFFNHSQETAKERLKEIVEKTREALDSIVYGIALIDTNELIGIISLDKVSLSNKNCSVAYKKN